MVAGGLVQRSSRVVSAEGGGEVHRNHNHDRREGRGGGDEGIATRCGTTMAIIRVHYSSSRAEARDTHTRGSLIQ